MMTVSEDCMVKLWDIKNLKKNSAFHSGKIEPCFTYRGHTGPLFSCCVGAGMQKEDHFLYSAGSEGIIRIWAIPLYESSKYPATNGKNYCVGLWTSHRDVVWQLVHHSKEPLLLSVSADGTVKMWKEFDLDEYTDNVDKNSNDCLLGAFVLKSPSKQYYEVPTSAAWIPSLSNSLVVSYINPILSIFDRVTGKSKQTISFEIALHGKSSAQQTNKVATHPFLPLIYGANENGMLRVFDINSSKQIKIIEAHGDSVSALAVIGDGHYFVTGGVDGIIKCWDSRKFQSVSEICGHTPKYGEGVHAIAAHSQMPFIATGGADCNTKIYFHSLL